MIQSQVAAMSKTQRSRTLFNFLLLANFFQYMEAGALPALLLSIANSFGMNSAQQGFLGGVVYLSLGTGGPFAGYLLRKFDHKTVIICAVAANMFFTFLWAMTPVGHVYSAYMFILMRFMMGLCQCIVCVFLPLWTNENAPRKSRTTWMSYLQASVPCGIMVGYIIASMCVYVSQHAETCWGMLCWRWPFLLEMSLLCPMYVCLYFVPAVDLSIKIAHYTPKLKKTNVNNPEPSSYGTHPSGDLEEHKAMQLDSSNQSLNEITHLPTSVLGNRGLSEGSSAQRWMSMQTLDEVEEKKHRMSWRRSSLSASMYDPMSTRDIIKRSHDDIALLDPADLTGFRWTGSSQAPSPYDQQPVSSTNSLPRPTISQDTLNSSPAVGNHNANSYCLGGVILDEGSMRDGGKNSKPATPTTEHPKTQLVLHKSPSFDSISRASHANAVSFAPFALQQQNQAQEEPGNAVISSTVKRNSTGANMLSIHYEPLKYESLKEVKRKSLSDDTTQHIHFFHPSTPNTSIKPGIGEIGTARRPRAQSFELHTLHSMGGSPVNNTLRKTRHSDTHLMPTEHTPLLRSEVGTPQVNSRQPRTVKTAPTVWAWLSSWFGQKQDSPEEASVNRVLYEHDSFRGREKHFKTLEMNIAIDPESDSQSGSDSEDEWMEYSPLKQRNFTFPETPLQPCTNPIPHSPGNVSGYATSSNVSHNLGGRMLDKLMYCMRCCKRERSHHHGHKKSWWKSVKALLCLPVYRNLLGAMSALYFTVTGVQYWGTKYLLISLHAPLLLVNVLFVLCAATGPVLGVFFGGYIIDVFGGYKGYKKRVSALKLVCTLGLIGCVCTLPITFLDNIYPVVLCLWLVLFFGGSSLPACAGILVSVVPRHHRPTSASLSLVVFNMCGYCLSLILSGLLMQVLEGHSEMCDAVCAMTWGFRLILFWSFLSFFFLLSAYLSARKYLQEREFREHQYERHQV